MRYINLVVLCGTVLTSLSALAGSCRGTPMATLPPATLPADPNATLPTIPPLPTGGSGSVDPSTGLPSTGTGSGTIGYNTNSTPGSSTPLGFKNLDAMSQGSCALGNQLSDIYALSRQTTDAVSYSANRFGLKEYNGDATQLGAVLQGTDFSSYASGYSLTLGIDVGCYIALEFTPTIAGSVQFTSDPSYGDAGIISLSTQPGQFLPTSSSVICTENRGAGNSLYVSTSAASGSHCVVDMGQTYYINFAASDYSGTPICAQLGADVATYMSCQVSYSTVTGVYK